MNNIEMIIKCGSCGEDCFKKSKCSQRYWRIEGVFPDATYQIPIIIPLCDFCHDYMKPDKKDNITINGRRLAIANVVRTNI